MPGRAVQGLPGNGGEAVKGAVLYRGVWLMPNSQAFEFHSKGEWKKLDAHMKALDAKQHALEGVVTP